MVEYHVGEGGYDEDKPTPERRMSSA